MGDKKTFFKVQYTNDSPKCFIEILGKLSFLRFIFTTTYFISILHCICKKRERDNNLGKLKDAVGVREHTK